MAPAGMAGHGRAFHHDQGWGGALTAAGQDGCTGGWAGAPGGKDLLREEGAAAAAAAGAGTEGVNNFTVAFHQALTCPPSPQPFHTCDRPRSSLPLRLSSLFLVHLHSADSLSARLPPSLSWTAVHLHEARRRTAWGGAGRGAAWMWRPPGLTYRGCWPALRGLTALTSLRRWR